MTSGGRGEDMRWTSLAQKDSRAISDAKRINDRDLIELRKRKVQDEYWKLKQLLLL